MRTDVNKNTVTFYKYLTHITPVGLFNVICLTQSKKKSFKIFYIWDYI